MALILSYYLLIFHSYSRCFLEDDVDNGDDERIQVDQPGELHGAALHLDEMLATRTEEALRLDDRASDDNPAGRDTHKGIDADSTLNCLRDLTG